MACRRTCGIQESGNGMQPFQELPKTGMLCPRFLTQAHLKRTPCWANGRASMARIPFQQQLAGKGSPLASRY